MKLTAGLVLSLLASAALCSLLLNGGASFPLFLSLCIVSTFGYGIIAPVCFRTARASAFKAANTAPLHLKCQ